MWNRFKAEILQISRLEHKDESILGAGRRAGLKFILLTARFHFYQIRILLYIYSYIYTLPPHAEELIGPQVNIFVFSPPPPLILLVVRCDLILLESFPGQLLFGRGRV